MKRIYLCLIFVLLFTFTYTSLASAAGGEKEFSAAELKNMSTFLSNFTELRFFDFDAAELLKSEEIIHFGIWHNYINNYKSRIASCKVKDCPHGSLTINAKHVEETIKKFFGADFNDHRSVKPDYEFHKEYLFYFDGELYHFDGADGDAVYYARVEKAVENSSGQIVMTGYLYNADDPDDTPGTFEAVAKPYKYGDKDTWAILSMETEYSQEEEDDEEDESLPEDMEYNEESLEQQVDDPDDISEEVIENDAVTVTEQSVESRACESRAK